MNIQDALKETGKAHRKSNVDGHYVEVVGGLLKWIRTGDIIGEVAFHAVIDGDWLTFHPKEEIIPKETGELWEHIDGAFAHTINYEDKLWFIRLSHSSSIDNVCMKGWKRIHPKVKEV